MEAERVTYIEMEDSYEAAVDEAKKITNGKLKVKEVSSSQLDQTIQLATQRMNLYDRVRETLRCIEEDLEKVEVMRSQKALQARPELPMKTEHGMQ